MARGGADLEFYCVCVYVCVCVCVCVCVTIKTGYSNLRKLYFPKHTPLPPHGAFHEERVVL